MMVIWMPTDERNPPRNGTLRRAARYIAALWARVTLLPAEPGQMAERKSWSETLRFPPF
jgi:hypothetical protein